MDFHGGLEDSNRYRRLANLRDKTGKKKRGDFQRADFGCLRLIETFEYSSAPVRGKSHEKFSQREYQKARIGIGERLVSEIRGSELQKRNSGERYNSGGVECIVIRITIRNVPLARETIVP